MSLMLKLAPLCSHDASVDPFHGVKFHRWVSERDASAWQIVRTLRDVAQCKQSHNLHLSDLEYLH